MLVWKAYSRMLDALAFSPDGRALAIGGYHLACRLIDAATGAPLWTVKSGSTFGLSLAFMSDGAVLCREGSALIRPPGGAPYRLGAGVSIRSAADGAKVRHCGRWCQSFGPAPGGCTVFVADGGHLDLVRRYDLRDGEPTGEVELEAGVINRIAVSPGGTVVAAVGTKQFSLLNADTLAVVASDAQRALSDRKSVV